MDMFMSAVNALAQGSASIQTCSTVLARYTPNGGVALEAIYSNC